MLGLAGNRQADDADFFTVALNNDGGKNGLWRLGIMQGGAGAKTNIGAEHGRLTGPAVQVAHQFFDTGVGVVKLMIPKNETVKADRIHQFAVSLAFAQGKVQIPGAGIATMHFDHVGRLGGQLTYCCGHPGEPTPFEADRLPFFSRGEQELCGFIIEMRVMIVDVEYGERKVLLRM